MRTRDEHGNEAAPTRAFSLKTGKNQRWKHGPARRCYLPTCWREFTHRKFGLPWTHGLAGCGVRLGNVPNDVCILDALMAAMPSALPSAPMPAQCLDDLDWTARAAFSGQWRNGARDDPFSFRKGTCVALWPRTCCTVSRRAWLGCVPDAVWFNGFVHYLFFSPVQLAGARCQVAFSMCMRDGTESDV